MTIIKVFFQPNQMVEVPLNRRGNQDTVSYNSASVAIGICPKGMEEELELLVGEKSKPLLIFGSSEPEDFLEDSLAGLIDSIPLNHVPPFSHPQLPGSATYDEKKGGVYVLRFACEPAPFHRNPNTQKILQAIKFKFNLDPENYQ